MACTSECDDAVHDGHEHEGEDGGDGESEDDGDGHGGPPLAGFRTGNQFRGGQAWRSML
jgi:hypothetical protein